MDNVRLKVLSSLIKFLLGTVVIGVLTLRVESSLQQREIEIKEQELIGKFLEHALQQDIGIRRRFAQYFSTVTRSDDARKRWKDYFVVLDAEYKETIKEKNRLEEVAKQNMISEEEKNKLQREIFILNEAIRPTQPWYTSFGDLHKDQLRYFQLLPEDKKGQDNEPGDNSNQNK